MTRITHNSVFANRLKCRPAKKPDGIFFARESNQELRPCRPHFQASRPTSPRLTYGPASTGRLYIINVLNNRVIHFVQCCGVIMRGIIIKSITPKDAQNLRRLQAIEGYIDLGMFEEAGEELRDLDPAWFALGRTIQLQLRVLAALSQPG